ncbi:hypothetical protein Tco_0279266 [Tanacetum coccineum]
MTDAQSSSVSSDLVSKYLNYSLDTGIDSLLNPSTQSTTLVNVPVIVATEIPPSSATPIPSPPTPVIHLQQQQQQQESTPDPTTTTNPTTSVPIILDFASLFKFETWVSTLERDLSDLNRLINLLLLSPPFLA